MGAVGVVLAVCSVTLIVLGMTSKSGGATAVIIGFIVVLLALYFVAGALRPAAVTADDTGLRTQDATMGNTWGVGLSAYQGLMCGGLDRYEGTNC